MKNFKELLIEYLNDDNNILAPPLIQLLKKVTEEYKPRSLSNTHSDSLKNLINYLDEYFHPHYYLLFYFLN